MYEKHIIDIISVLASNPTSTTTFDINKLTRYYQELKIGALLTLNMEEFLEFFYGDNPLDSKYLNKVMRVVSKEVQEFWGELVNTFGCNLILSNLFMKSKATKENAIKYNDFLKSPKAYNHAKRALIYHAYAFHHLDFNDLGTLKKKFDTIFLSGILDYQNCGIETMVAIIKEKTKDILKPNGIVIASTFKGSYLEENVYKDTYTLEKVSGTIASIKIK